MKPLLDSLTSKFCGFPFRIASFRSNEFPCIYKTEIQLKLLTKPDISIRLLTEIKENDYKYLPLCYMNLRLDKACQVPAYLVLKSFTHSDLKTSKKAVRFKFSFLNFLGITKCLFKTACPTLAKRKKERRKKVI